MGADSRWVCHTCKTVCSEEGRPLLKSVREHMAIEDIVALKLQVADLDAEVEILDVERATSFLDNLGTWLERHKDHEIHIGSDYSTDMMELDDYHDETIKGKVAKITKHEARCLDANAFEETSIQEISTVIQACIDGRAARDGAIELYNRFSMKDL